MRYSYVNPAPVVKVVEVEPEVKPAPLVLASSRDGQPAPYVTEAARLAKAAEAAGWQVRQTYALAVMPATDRRSAYWLASLAVRLARGEVRAWAVWHQADGLKWTFDAAALGQLTIGARALKKAVTA